MGSLSAGWGWLGPPASPGGARPGTQLGQSCGPLPPKRPRWGRGGRLPGWHERTHRWDPGCAGPAVDPLRPRQLNHRGQDAEWPRAGRRPRRGSLLRADTCTAGPGRLLPSRQGRTPPRSSLHPTPPVLLPLGLPNSASPTCHGDLPGFVLALALGWLFPLICAE